MTELKPVGKDEQGRTVYARDGKYFVMNPPKVVETPVSSSEPSEENPKSPRWKMERRKKYRKATGADAHAPPKAGTRSKAWRKGHTRSGGTKVKGHYMKVNPICPKCGTEINPPAGQAWTMERRKKYRKATGADPSNKPKAHSRVRFWVKGHKRDGKKVAGHMRKANPQPPQPMLAEFKNTHADTTE